MRFGPEEVRAEGERSRRWDDDEEANDASDAATDGADAGEAAAADAEATSTAEAGETDAATAGKDAVPPETVSTKRLVIEKSKEVRRDRGEWKSRR